MATPRRFLQFGTGWWGEGWAHEVASSERSELVGLVDVDRVSLDRVADQIGLPADHRFTSVDEALAAVEADCALIVVPPADHAPVAMAAIDEGLHILMEKPFAPTPAHARPVVAAAEAAGRRLMISQTFRFRRGPRTVQSLIRRGLIGEVEQVFGRFHKATPFEPDNFRCLMDEPLIIDMAIHHFDFIRGVFGLEPHVVRARSWNPSWSWYRGNASATVEFETPGGAMVSWQGSYCSRGPLTTWDGAWEIHGTRGSLHWADNEVYFRPTELADTVYTPGALELPGDLMRVPLVDPPTEERAAVLEEFLDALDEDRAPEPSGADNLGSIGLVLAAATSATNGGTPVLVSDI
ncbi:MAG: Gfo/Idh/MocA family oxidoreductase [Candidatus Nanopelagicales bacterium]